MDIRNIFFGIIGGCALMMGAASCVKTDFTVGSNFLPENERFKTRVLTIAIDSIEQRSLEKLSGYSNVRMCVGSMRDEINGMERVTRKGSAVTLIPISDTLDWGQNPKFDKFMLVTAKDTTNVISEDQRFIMQNLCIYNLADIYEAGELGEKSFTDKFKYTNDIKPSMFRGKECVTQGTPVYGGEKNIIIPFNEKFAESYMGKGKEVLEDLEVEDSDGEKKTIDKASVYTRKHPGIYICTDDPVGMGGRFNFIKMAVQTDDSYSITNCYAELKFNAEFEKNGKMRRRDTSIVFLLGADAVSSSANYYAFNTCEDEFVSEISFDKAKEFVTVDGGTGIKPMIRAEYLRKEIIKKLSEELKDEFSAQEVEDMAIGEQLIINRATINLPYELPEDHKLWQFYPQTLNPTVCVKSSDGNDLNYAGLTDASVSDENQGEIDRSNLCYRPDISHHMQQILAVPATEKDSLNKYNIWFMILAEETYATQTQTNSNQDYYNQMAYLSYYNQMMGGYGYGYGGYGYGGYGGYGNYGYNNYYNYYMMQAYYNSLNSGSNTTTASMLDKDRYYACKLNGPKAADAERRPYLSIVYSYVPASSEEE